MIHAYAVRDGRLAPLPPDALEQALWIDLFRPTARERAAVAALGLAVPAAEQMAEIQPSRRYRRGTQGLGMTVFLPGKTSEGARTFGPVAFLVQPDRLVTVHDHALDALEGAPDNGERLTGSDATPGGLMLAILDVITGQIADRLEDVDAVFDRLADDVFGSSSLTPAALREMLQRAGQMGMRLSAMQHGLLTVERGLVFATADGGAHLEVPAPALEALERDVKSLAAHCEYLSGRANALTDATLGLIDLAQNRSFSIISAVTALFVPPTFIASFYGMNFTNIPELHSPQGFAVVLALMALSVFGAYLFLRWRRLL